jgi:hypothetical protein
MHAVSEAPGHVNAAETTGTSPPAWRCGHPRTPHNTHRATERAHAQCRTCRLASQARANARYDETEAGRARRRRYERGLGRFHQRINYRVAALEAELGMTLDEAAEHYGAKPATGDDLPSSNFGRLEAL